MDVSERVISHLEALGADFTVVSIDPAFADTAAFCERYGYTAEVSANAIVVASRRPPVRHAVCVLLATTRLDVNHAVRSHMAVQKLSFADADATRALTGMEIGGVTPFGLADEIPVLVDAAVMEVERCVVGGGSRSLKIEVDPSVFKRMSAVTVVDGLARGVGS